MYLFIFFTVIIYNSLFNNFFYKILFVNKKIIEELKKLALKAKKNDEVPISAIIAEIGTSSFFLAFKANFFNSSIIFLFTNKIL